jgi:cytochrome c-type biogenesis protein CcmH/NrfG
MASEPATALPATALIVRPTWPSTQVYAMAAVCLFAGLGIGYLLRTSSSPAQVDVNGSSPALQSGARTSVIAQGATSAARASADPHAGNPHAGLAAGRMPSLTEMKQMADKQAAPLLAKLKTDPKNTALLVQVGAIYHSTHQFKEAASYYQRAVDADPKSIANRNKLASSLYRDGEVDAAIAQLNQALSSDPTDPNSLFNLGMIKMQGKQDARGALAAWRQLLKTNPQLSENRRSAVQTQIAEAVTMMSDQHGAEGAHSSDQHKQN